MSALLGETFRLFGRHLDLFTLIALTVWLPGHLLANYLEFFGPRDDPRRVLSVLLTVEAVFGPLVAGAMLTTLARIKRGLPVGYWTAMGEGLPSWGRLFIIRLIVGLLVLLGFVALVIPGLILLVRFALVDSVVVLEGSAAGSALSRSAALTAGQRREIFVAGALLFTGLVSLGMLLSQLMDVIPLLKHFVARVLVDCVLAVAQSVFTVALFLFYWRASRVAATSPPSSPS